MTPEEIVEQAAELGVIFFLDYDKIRFYGKTPKDWIYITEKWLPQKQDVIEYLKNPSDTHRKRVGDAMLALIKARRGLPCIYLGELINPKPSCGCGAQHKCAIYGECVVSGKGAGKWRVCTECPNYKME